MPGKENETSPKRKHEIVTSGSAEKMSEANDARHTTQCLMVALNPIAKPLSTAQVLPFLLREPPSLARFSWVPLDKPQDGSTFTAYRPLEYSVFPADGYGYMSEETMKTIKTAQGLMMDVFENKSGFRESDEVCSIMRTRFRISSNPIQLVQYLKLPPNEEKVPVVLRNAKVLPKTGPLPVFDTIEGIYLVSCVFQKLR
ncbi:hypothetical protein HK096_000464 [Nowakowskiella sp. JEL0078]|nr:hypothetical protein HK096_000464 [Nowakowskiella sp. JEL0078]